MMATIVLDANFLVALADHDSSATSLAKEWLQLGKSIATSCVAWAEFCTGPIDPADMQSMEWLLEDRILAFGQAEAECAARLYRIAGCKHQHRMDSFIAATAIVSRAPLATRNHRDFRRFVPFGLKLA